MENPMPSFVVWLSRLMGQDLSQVSKLLKNQTAQEFLISWSLFESKCFSGELRGNGLRKHSRDLEEQGFAVEQIETQFSAFRDRYEGTDAVSKERLSNLLPIGKTNRDVQEEFLRCLRADRSSLSVAERIFFVSVVVYRYRNNMFHGAKGVSSWLKYEEQIALCTQAMQAYISHAEERKPTLKDSSLV
jgi:hypothetical protein